MISEKLRKQAKNAGTKLPDPDALSSADPSASWVHLHRIGNTEEICPTVQDILSGFVGKVKRFMLKRLTFRTVCG